MRTGIIVFGHGSSVASANEAVKAVAAAAAAAAGWHAYETAFLEADPRLNQAVSNLAKSGIENILVLPYFLTLGIHLQCDLPKLVQELEREYSVRIRVAPPLDGHPELSRILVDRAAEVLTKKL